MSHSSHNIQSLVVEMKGDISKTVGETMTDEVEKVLGLFAANAEAIENNFAQLRQQISEMQDNVIGTIKSQKSLDYDQMKEEIRLLQELVKEKDLQIRLQY